VWEIHGIGEGYMHMGRVLMRRFEFSISRCDANDLPGTVCIEQGNIV
jgi:hypothetical protein